MSTTRIRLGLYMHTPILGGAELYFKDLLWNIDRNRYEVTLFFESWPEFDEFLDLRHCPEAHICPVPVIEPGGHFRPAKPGEDPMPTGRSVTRTIFSRLRAIKKRMPPAVQTASGRLAGVATRYPVMPINYVRLRRALIHYPVDILHINNGGYPGSQSAQVAAIVGKRAGCRYSVMSIASTPLPRQSPHLLERFVDAQVSRALDKVIVLSDVLGQRIIRERGFRASQIVTVPYGFRDSSTGSDGPLRELDGVRASEPGQTIGMVASFLPVKAHPYLIKAIAILRDRFPSLRVILIGDGPTRSQIESLVRERGVESHVAFMGYRPQAETLRLMRQLDIVTLSSEIEGMPYVILQAMCFAKPVVATSVGGIPDVIRSGETGFIVPPKDPSALAEALARLLENPGLARQMGQNGYARYQAEFTVERMIQRHQAIYESLTGG